jgi:hypothetical protein
MGNGELFTFTFFRFPMSHFPFSHTVFGILHWIAMKPKPDVAGTAEGRNPVLIASASMRKLVTVAYAAPFVLFVAIYLPSAGHGFIQDDYSWILHSRARDLSDVVQLFRTDNGFYRPIVALTFAANEWVFGNRPYGYGATNVVLALLCSASIVRLARALQLPAGAAALAGALWLLNLHGIRMAVLWISGRTALALTLAATMCATAVVRRRTVAATAWLLVALFGKEEAVVLPLVLLLWLCVLQRSNESRGMAPMRWFTAAAAAEVVYFIARASTHAMTPFTAPSFYRPLHSVTPILSNIGSYADRVGTLPVLIVLIAWLTLGWSGTIIGSRAKVLCQCGLAWLAGGFALTVFLPVRSDLYACFPSVGACLIAATVCAAIWHNAPPPRERRAVVVALIALGILAPIHYVRTGRWVRLAEFATNTLSDLQRLSAHLPDGSTVVIYDDRRDRVNLGSAFGTLLNEAYGLSNPKRLLLWVEPPAMNAREAGLRPPCPTCADLRLAVSKGRLRPIPTP